MYTTSSEVADIFWEMVLDMRYLFKQAEVVLSLLMVVPGSSAECRGRVNFQCLEMSENMSEKNNNADPAKHHCHLHQEKSDALNRKQNFQSKVELNDEHHVFGSLI